MAEFAVQPDLLDVLLVVEGDGLDNLISGPQSPSTHREARHAAHEDDRADQQPLLRAHATAPPDELGRKSGNAKAVPACWPTAVAAGQALKDLGWPKRGAKA
jgi:hypothetical protein